MMPILVTVMAAAVLYSGCTATDNSQANTSPAEHLVWAEPVYEPPATRGTTRPPPPVYSPDDARELGLNLRKAVLAAYQEKADRTGYSSGGRVYLGPKDAVWQVQTQMQELRHGYFNLQVTVVATDTMKAKTWSKIYENVKTFQGDAQAFGRTIAADLWFMEQGQPSAPGAKT